MKVSPGQLQAYASHIISDEDCLQHVRDRLALRWIEMFRSANAEKREEISRIMDTEQAFFDELKKILDDAVQTKDINDTEDDADKN